jgi:ABC-type sugar transport system ATPase subunit
LSLLKLNHVSKGFSGTPVLKEISIELERGQALGIIGENGAGKSTLIKILSGVYQPDRGSIIWQGNTVTFKSPEEALAAGIGTIHQELSYFEKLTVAENLMMGERWPRKAGIFVDWRKLYQAAAGQLSRFELQIDPEAPLNTLTAGQRQEISIVRALSRNSKLLILDEPTASLSEPEVLRLMGHLETLKKHGVALIYVSHRLEEILKLTSKVAVLRDGSLIAEYPSREATIKKMVGDMVGRELSQGSARTFREPGAVLFEMKELSRRKAFEKVSVQLRGGEIVGMAGLLGSGRSELARVAMGFYPPTGGEMFMRGSRWQPQSAREAVNSGMVYIPEERKRQGFVLEHSVKESISIGLLEQISRWGMVRGRVEKERVMRCVEYSRMKMESPNQPIGTLSGGNQQKALLGRWLERDPEILIFHEPTRGVDIGAKAEIYKIMDDLVQQGKAILLISSDLPELLALSDRIIVMHRGSIVSEVKREGATQEKILLAACGLAQR